MASIRAPPATWSAAAGVAVLIPTKPDPPFGISASDTLASVPAVASSTAFPVAEFLTLSWLTALAVVVKVTSSLLLLSAISGDAMLNWIPVERVVNTVFPAITWRICALVVDVI